MRSRTSIQLLLVAIVAASGLTAFASDRQQTLADAMAGHYGALLGTVRLGAGFDRASPHAFKGRVAGGIEAPAIVPQRKWQVFSTVVSDESDARRLDTRGLAASAYAFFGTTQASASAAFRQTSSSRRKHKSVSWVFVAWQVTQVHTLRTLQLSDEAESLLPIEGSAEFDEDLTHFRDTYGTEVVSEVLHGVEVQLWLTATADESTISEESETAFRTAVKGVISGGRITGGVRNLTDSLLRRMTLEVHVDGKGIDLSWFRAVPTLQSIDDVDRLGAALAAALEKSNVQAVPIGFKTTPAKTLGTREQKRVLAKVANANSWVDDRDANLIRLHKEVLDARRVAEHASEWLQDPVVRTPEVTAGLELLRSLSQTYIDRINDAGRKWIDWKGGHGKPEDPVATFTLTVPERGAARAMLDSTPGTKGGEVDVRFTRRPRLLAHLERQHPRTVRVSIDAIEYSNVSPGNNCSIEWRLDVSTDPPTDREEPYVYYLADDQSNFLAGGNSRRVAGKSKLIHLGRNWKTLRLVLNAGYANGRDGTQQGSIEVTPASLKSYGRFGMKSFSWRSDKTAQASGKLHFSITPVYEYADE